MQGNHLEPETVVGVLAIVVICAVALYRLFVWFRDAPISPDPWSQEITQSLDEPDAVQVCHRCFTPQPPGQWFCEHCGCAVGDYNNLMPYVHVFSEGEVFRNGVTDRLRVNALTVIGYVALSLWCYIVFAPFYWYFLFKNLRRIKHGEIDNAAAGTAC